MKKDDEDPKKLQLLDQLAASRVNLRRLATKYHEDEHYATEEIMLGFKATWEYHMKQKGIREGKGVITEKIIPKKVYPKKGAKNPKGKSLVKDETTNDGTQDKETLVDVNANMFNDKEDGEGNE